MAYALDALSDATDATRAFLTPFDRGRWVRLAVVAFFVFGSVGGMPSFPGNVGGQFDTGSDGGAGGPDGWEFGGWSGEFDPSGLIDGALLSGLSLWILVVAVVAIAIGILYGMLGGIMEFVLYESLRSERVSIREYAGRYADLGLRLFAFRFVLGLVGLAVVLGVVALFVFSVFGGPGTFFAALLVLFPLFLVLALVGGLVNLFTTEFVAPIMLIEDRGVISGWRRFWGVFRAEWLEFLAYAAVRFGLNIAAGLVVGLVVGLVAFVLGIPFGAVALAIWFALGTGTGWVAIGGVAIVALLYALVLLVAAMLVTVPVLTYLRYYALLVLGDVDETLDLIPDRRAAIRSTGTERSDY